MVEPEKIAIKMVKEIKKELVKLIRGDMTTEEAALAINKLYVDNVHEFVTEAIQELTSVELGK